VKKATIITLSFALLSLQISFDVAATSITVKNRTNTDRIQWVHTTVPFAKGEVETEAVINRGTLATNIVAVAKFKNDPRLYYATFLNNIRTVTSDSHT